MAADECSAQAAIDEHRVLVSGAPATAAGRMVAPGEPVHLVAPPGRFVSRGGHKLDAALDRFGVKAVGRRSLDAGASTGGFTDCLLQRGAPFVVALDVGRGQLHQRLRQDGRVTVLDRTNIRRVEPEAIGAPFDLVVADLSFISLRTVAASLVGCAGPGADMVVLVKPQFEAQHDEVTAGRGVITDPAIWLRTLVDAGAALAACGTAIMSAMISPLPGADGNVEFLMHLAVPGSGRHLPDRGVDFTAVVAEAAGER